jgi:two-component system nitrogen regulation response regulator NtrX
MVVTAKATILVVDDEEGIVETLSSILEDEGYEVVTAASGEQALSLVKEYSPEIILLDVWMPLGMDGLETLKNIKEINQEPAVIMISGHATIDRLFRQPSSVPMISSKNPSPLKRFSLSSEGH